MVRDNSLKPREGSPVRTLVAMPEKKQHTLSSGKKTTCLGSLCRQKPELGLATAISPGGPCPGGLHLETG